MKRLIDFIFSFIGILIFSPLIIVFSILIWLQDFHNPFYFADRVGKNFKIFKMVKFRSMIVNADLSGVDSTSSNDQRITKLGSFIRKYKLDEIPQLFNVILGQMSLVGPRPNVKRETDLYTQDEKLILSYRPGITDFSSIVFSDEGDILKNSQDPDLDYNQLIRPWKSRLAIFYVLNSNLFIDFKIIFLTIFSLINKEKVLFKISRLLESKNANTELIEITKRKKELKPTPPPGSNEIVSSR